MLHSMQCNGSNYNNYSDNNNHNHNHNENNSFIFWFFVFNFAIFWFNVFIPGKNANQCMYNLFV